MNLVAVSDYAEGVCKMFERSGCIMKDDGSFNGLYIDEDANSGYHSAQIHICKAFDQAAFTRQPISFAQSHQKAR